MPPRTFLPILLVSWLLTACAMPGFVRTGPEPPSRPSDIFKVLTYNALHGLEVGRFWVRRAESTAAHRARFRRRIEGLAHAQPDLILLQEVNPLPQMAVDYVQALRSFGVTYSEVHQVDSCGLRLAPGLALLPGLNNGLVILAKAPFQIRKLEGVKLTGIERDARILHELMEAHRQGRLIRYDDLMGELVRGQERRLEEQHTLVEALRKYQTGQEHAGVIIGGDFNFEAGSPEYRELERLGFQDTFMAEACLRQTLFGAPATPGELPESDHYGILNTYAYRMMPC